LCNFAAATHKITGKIKGLLDELQNLPDETSLEVYLETLRVHQVVNDNAVGGKRKTRRRRSL
jgi:hypothetical protein